MPQAEYGVWCSEPTGGWWFTSSTVHGTPPIVFKTMREAQKKARAVQKTNGGVRSDVVYSARIYKCPPRRLVTRDVPSQATASEKGFTRPFKIPMPESVTRKFLRMTNAERTRFVELFAGFTSLDWRRFRAMIRKLSGGKT